MRLIVAAALGLGLLAGQDAAAEPRLRPDQAPFRAIFRELVEPIRRCRQAAAPRRRVYGVPGLFRDPDGDGIHGLNERISVKVLYDGRDYIFDLIKAYVGD
jgi:hypothetical protein